jgi:beta-lactamase regulating signal transducer with metallopeptidase domain
MMARLILELVVRAALLVVGTAAVLYVMRIRAAALRHRVWTVMVVAMLLLPIWTPWGPKLSLRVLPVLPETTVEGMAPLQRATSNRLLSSTAISGPQAVLLGVYFLGAGLFLFRLALGTFRARKLIRGSAPHNGIYTNPLCAAPITVGFVRPVVIFPEHWQQRTQAQLESVLAHEGEHARRRDPLVQWLALLNRAIFWFHPAAWWVERSLSALAEEACDDHVLARGHNPADYAECLIDIARSVTGSGARVNVTGMAMPGNFLPQRIRRIIAGSPVQRITPTRMVFLAVACSITCTVFAAGALDHVKRDSRAQAAQTPNKSDSTTKAVTKFVLGDLKIEEQVRDRDAVQARILKQWRDREYSDVKELEDTVLEVGVRADFQDRGYFKVVVQNSKAALSDVMDGKQRVLIVVAVTEGPQFRLGNLTIQYVPADRPMVIPVNTIREQFRLREGDLFNVGKIRAGLESVQALYAARGYKDATLEPATNVDEARRVIDFTLRVMEGFRTK